MIEFVICAIAILLASAVALYRFRSEDGEQFDPAYIDAWWHIMPM